MVTVIWAPPDMPDERHIVVRVHRDGVPGTSDKGYFHISDEKDWGRLRSLRHASERGDRAGEGAGRRPGPVTCRRRAS